MTAERPLITISIPVFNEFENIDRLIARLESVFATEPGYRFEILFTDNDSTDGTFEKLAEKAKDNPHIRALKFSRNFGFQKSILTNYLEARGVAAIQIDADLQDPPELISGFLREWEKGYKVVYGIRKRRRENPVIHLLRRTYYKVVAYLSHVPLPTDAGDFRLIDRVIIEHLRRIDEQTPYLRGLIASLGYPQTGISYDREQRTAGRSKFRMLQLIELGIDGITAQSTRPLRLITMVGVLLCVLMVPFFLYYLLVPFVVSAQVPSGFTTIVLLLIFLIGFNALLMGVIGEYIGRIFNNTRSLPITIVEQRVEHPRAEQALDPAASPKAPHRTGRQA